MHQFDPCYHLACDTFANNSDTALDVNSDAIAFAVLTYAYSTETVNGVPGTTVPGNFTIPPPPGRRAPVPAAAGRRRTVLALQEANHRLVSPRPGDGSVVAPDRFSARTPRRGRRCQR